MDIQELRQQIDEIDDEILDLFCKRMDIASQIGVYKKENDIRIHDPAREIQKLSDISSKAGNEMSNYSRILYATLFELSRAYQHQQSPKGSKLYQRIMRAIEQSPRFLRSPPAIACCSHDTSYSRDACNQIFIKPFVVNYRNILDVFKAVERETCRYGLIPLDNYFGGTASIVYDLILQYKFYIVGGANIRTDYNLYVKPGTQLSDIQIVYGHRRVFHACMEFICELENAALEHAETDLQAAYNVSTSHSPHFAALCSKTCGEYFGLHCLFENIYDPKNPRNKYVCFGKKLEIFPGPRKSCFMFIMNNTPGSLYRLVSRLNVLGIDITLLNPRVVPENIDHIQVYLEIEVSIYDDSFKQFMESIDEFCLEYKYMGSYSEKYT